KAPASRVVGVDTAVAVVADEQSAAERTKIGRSQGEPPRRVQCTAGGQAPHQAAGGVVNIGEAVPCPRDILAPVLVLLGVGDEEEIVDVLDVEWRKAVRQARVLEGTRMHYRPEIFVENVDAAAAEVGSVEEAVAARIRGEGKSRAVDGRSRGRVID